MCNFGRKHQRYLIAMHCVAWYAVQNKRRQSGLDKVAYIFYSNHYTKHVDQVEV